MAKEKKEKAEAVKGSVRDKEFAIEEQRKENERAVEKIAEGKAKMEDAIKSEARKFARESKEMLKEGKERMTAGVKKFNADIEEQKKEQGAAVKKIEVAVRNLERDIKAKQAEFEDYTKLFWG